MKYASVISGCESLLKTFLCTLYIELLKILVFIAGSIPWFLVAELFKQGPRPIATSIAVAVNWFANFIVGLCFLPLTVSFSLYLK